jgi:uncharacterized membrane protein YdbT with pleckstrin-like domain
MIKCSDCGKETSEDQNFCPSCGTKLGKKSVPDLESELKETKEKVEELEKKSKSQEDRDYTQTMYKSESTTLVLAIVLGLFGISGVGHIYLGKVGKGIAILIVNIVLAIIGGATIIIGIGIIFLIIYLVIFIWQIVDARSLCQYYNSHIREKGKRPLVNKCQ